MANGIHEEQQALTKLDPGSLIQQAIEHNSGVDTLERLLAMAMQVRHETAREQWHEAMARFQAEAPTLQKSKLGGGASSYTYKFAGLDQIVPKLRPVLAKHGLSVTYKTLFGQGCVTAICRIAHECGHVEETEFTVPVDTGGSMNAAQKIGSASTYARRYGLLAALGLAPEDDPDAADVPSPSQPVQMPQRTAEVVPSAAAEISAETTITDIEEKSGTKKNGDPWTRYGIKCGNGVVYGTFSKTVAEAAQPFTGTGEQVTVWYTDDGKYKNAVGIVGVGAPEA